MTLLKAIAEYLAKTGMASHYQKKADHHDAMSKLHEAQHNVLKAHVEGAADDPAVAVHKAAMVHHDGKMQLHKTMSAHYGGMAAATTKFIKDCEVADVQKCAHEKPMSDACTECKRDKATELPTNLVDMGSFLQKQVAKAFETIGTSTDFQKMLQTKVTEMAMAALGGVVVPDSVRGAAPNNPGVTVKAAGSDQAPQLVFRTNQDEEQLIKEVEKVAPEHRHLLQRSPVAS